MQNTITTFPPVTCTCKRLVLGRDWIWSSIDREDPFLGRGHPGLSPGLGTWESDRDLLDRNHALSNNPSRRKPGREEEETGGERRRKDGRVEMER